MDDPVSGGVESSDKGSLLGSTSGIVSIAALAVSGTTFAYARHANSSTRKKFGLVAADLDELGKRITTLTRGQKNYAKLLEENEELKQRVSELESTVMSVETLLRKLTKDTEEETTKVPKPRRLPKKPKIHVSEEEESMVLSTKALRKTKPASHKRRTSEPRGEDQSEEDVDASEEAEKQDRRQQIASLM